MRAAGLVLIGLTLIAACAGPPPRPVPAEREAVPAPAPAPAPTEGAVLGARVASLARGFIGRPYRYGGDTPAGFDCSGLVYYVYRSLGVAVPRTAAEQRASVSRIPADALLPGDLVFFYTPEDHVGIYLGGSEFVHAPASGRLVERARLDSPFFILGFAGAGRIATP